MSNAMIFVSIAWLYSMVQGRFLTALILSGAMLSMMHMI